MTEYITTRTYYSKELDEQTYSELTLIAKKLGILREILWHQFSSNPKKLNDRKIRDIWLREKENGTNLYPKIIDQLPARLWKETLRDTIGNINAYFEAGFTEIIKRLYRKYGKTEAKKLAKTLKTDYKSNNELHRMVRALIPKGYSKADNIICLDEDCYSFKDDQTNIIQVTSLRPMKRLFIPLTTKNRPKGNFKIILKDGRLELKEKIYSAAKILAQKASIIAIEDLTFKTKPKGKFKKVNRRLSSWIKGVIDEAIIKYCFIYGTKLVYVNAAYTSQGDSRFNCALMGTRIGDSFIGFDEVVLDADINAAINILARLYDSEINLYTSAEKVKEILTKRADAVLSASVETAQLGLQDVAPINLELHPKSGLSGNFNKDLTRFS